MADGWRRGFDPVLGHVDVPASAGGSGWLDRGGRAVPRNTATMVGDVTGASGVDEERLRGAGRGWPPTTARRSPGPAPREQGGGAGAAGQVGPALISSASEDGELM